MSLFIKIVLADFPVRLAGGSTIGEGRVEIFYKNTWATVCDDAWGNNDASVVCKQLGFNHTGSAVTEAGFGQGSGTILLDEVRCTGDESNIFHCPHDGFENHDCFHFEDTGVRCGAVPSKYCHTFQSLPIYCSYITTPFTRTQ